MSPRPIGSRTPVRVAEVCPGVDRAGGDAGAEAVEDGNVAGGGVGGEEVFVGGVEGEARAPSSWEEPKESPGRLRSL